MQRQKPALEALEPRLLLSTETFPSPSALLPQGSLIYSETVSRWLSGAPDSYEIDLDPGQTLTVMLRPGSEDLRAEVEITGPGGTSLAVAQAEQQGDTVLIQTVPADDAGTYVIEARTLAAEGPYSLDLFLNAAFRQEQPGGVAPGNLIAFYDFEGNADDASGNGYDGIVQGAVLHAGGYEGQAYSFDGWGQHIDLPLDVSASVYPQLTMGAWVRADTGADGQTVIGTEEMDWQRSLSHYSMWPDDGWVAFSGSAGTGVVGFGTVQVDEWQFLAAVYDQPGQSVTLYVDDEVYSGDANMTVDGHEVEIGSNTWWDEHFDGLIDNVFFYDVALTPMEIAAIRAGGVGAILGDKGDKDAFTNAQDLEDSFIGIAAGAERGAVVSMPSLFRQGGGLGPDGFGYSAEAVAPEFEDIAGIGTPISFEWEPATSLGPWDLDGFEFEFYGQTYDEFYISQYGVISFGEGVWDGWNGPLDEAMVWCPLIAVFWDQLWTGDGMEPKGPDEVLYDLRGPEGSRELIIQWDEVHFAEEWEEDGDGPLGDPITFQAILAEADGSIRFNYANLDAGVPDRDGGASATVGIRNDEESAHMEGHILQVSYDEGPNEYVGSHQSILFSLGSGGEIARDAYRFELDVGEPASMAMSRIDGGQGGSLELYDSEGCLLTVGVGGEEPWKQDGEPFVLTIDGFVPDEAGDYFLRVETTGDYSLVVARGAGLGLSELHEYGEYPDISDTGVLLGGVVDGGNDECYISVSAGDELTIWTTTPFDGPNEYNNVLNPSIYLYDEAYSQVAYDHDSFDGRNASLTHTAASSGEYIVRVKGMGGWGDPANTGDYVLHVEGATGEPASFEVISSYPSDGSYQQWYPWGYSVTFNEEVLLTSLDVEDMTVNGVAADDVDVDQNRYVTFGIGPAFAGDAVYNVAIPAGAVRNLAGRPNEAFTASFTLDSTPPVVIASSVGEADTITTSTLTYQVQFSEELLTSYMGPQYVALANTSVGLDYEPDSYEYEAATSTLTIAYTDLLEGEYTLTLRCDRYMDLAYNQLDGWPSFPLPSGDGFDGGDFVVNFTFDRDVEALGAMEAVDPLGSLICASRQQGRFASDSDIDAFTAGIEAGQLLTVALSPQDPSIQAGVEVRDSGGAAIASATAAGPGEAVVLQAVGLESADTYQVVCTNHAGSGGYDLQILLNAAAELEDLGGAPNDALPDAEDLEASMLPLGDGLDRLAAYGRSEGAADHYSFTLGEDQIASMVLTPQGGGDLDLALLDESGTLVTLGVKGTANVGESIDGWIVPASGLYVVRVTGDADEAYSLVVTRGGQFDLEPNDADADAQPVVLVDDGEGGFVARVQGAVDHRPI
ncbi:MAG: LamG domain-containing protein, partial [Phycisphaerae bacterium]